MKTIDVITQARDIPIDWPAVYEITGEKPYTIIDHLRVYGDGGIEHEFKAPSGSLLLKDDRGNVQLIHEAKLLRWTINQHHTGYIEDILEGVGK